MAAKKMNTDKNSGEKVGIVEAIFPFALLGGLFFMMHTLIKSDEKLAERNAATKKREERIRLFWTTLESIGSKGIYVLIGALIAYFTIKGF